MSHLPGLRQRTRTITLRVDKATLQTTCEIARLDQVLERWTGLPPCESAGASPTPALLVDRLLALAAHLLRAARVPVFEAGLVVRIVPGENDTFEVVARVPVVDPLPPAQRNSAYKLAIRILQAGLEPSAAERDHESLQKSIHDGFIEPVRGTVSEGGKSSIGLLWAAYDAEIPFLHLGASRYCLGWGARAMRLHRSSVSTDSHLGASAAQRKSLTTQLLRQVGIPVPLNHLVLDAQQAIEAARAIGWPVVVKPDDRDRGEGVTTGIDDDTTLAAAFEAANRLSRRVLVEAQAPGICHRVLVGFGSVLFAVTRFPRRIQGDGRSTIRELITLANHQASLKPLWERSNVPQIDNVAEAELSRQGLTAESVPTEGRWVYLRPRESTEWGGESGNVTDHLHPDNAAICVRAARQMGLDIAGVDLMTDDASIPWHKNSAVIIEVNSAPFVSGGPRTRALLRKMFETVLPHAGRIPVHAILGAVAAWKRAEKIRAEAAASNERCYITDHDRTVGPDRTELVLTAKGLYARCTALLLDPDVDRIVLVVSNEELLRTGSPVDRFTTVEDRSGRQRSRVGLDADAVRRLKGLLEPMLEGPERLQT